MLVIKSEFDFEISEENELQFKLKNKSNSRFNFSLIKPYEYIRNKKKSLHIESLDFSTIKRNIRRFCERKFKLKSKYSGYEQFLTDEEKRCLVVVCESRVVEGF